MAKLVFTLGAPIWIRAHQMGWPDCRAVL